MKRISLAEVEFVAHSLAKELMAWDEPIPEFRTRYPKGLESCIEAAFQTFGRKPLYGGLSGKAAILFYLLVKNHPFQNGNKRVAVMALLYFLARNGWWIMVDNDDLYLFANEVAQSSPKHMHREIAKIRIFIRKNMTKAEG